MERASLAWVAAAIVMVSNGVGLGLAWRNRTATPEAAVLLTEREVRLVPRETENTALALNLVWIDPSRAPSAVTWFDAAKLRAVGFDGSAAPTPDNRRFYEGQIPRAAYAALEFEGDGWIRYLESLAPGKDREEAFAGSHLVVVDAGLDPLQLRRLHPDRSRVIIAPAIVSIEIRRSPSRPPAIGGYVSAVYPLQVNVPKWQRAALEALAEARREAFEPHEKWRGTPLGHAPRYQALIHWGRAREPWLARILSTPTKLSG